MDSANLAHAALGAAVTTAFYPLTYARVLIQVGHEPIAPKPTTTIWGTRAYSYPNIFQYLGHIRREDGFLGMYRGLAPKLCGGIISTAVTSSVQKYLKEHYDDSAFDEVDGDDYAEIKKLCRDTTHETVARCLSIVCAQPFQVIMVRSMIQFVGKETEYDGLFSSIATIYKNEGILGFFSGLLPRLLGEVITIWLAGAVAYIADKYVVPHMDAAHANYKKGFTKLFWEALGVSHLTYPFMLVSNVMATNNCGLLAVSPPRAPVYTSWTQCWSMLDRQGQLKRGSSVFFRYAPKPALH